MSIRERNLYLRVIYLVCLILIGCTKKSQPLEKRPQESNNQVSGRGENSIRLEKTGESGHAKSMQSKSNSFLPYAIETRITPSDFVIGTLQDFIAPDSEKSAVLKLAENFNAALCNGTIPDDYFQINKRDYLRELLRFNLVSGSLPFFFRIGSIQFESTDRCLIYIRYFTDLSAASGTINFIRENGQWYITDLQVNFQKLTLVSSRSREKFSPSTYAWISRGF